MPSTPKPVVVWPISGTGADDTRVVLEAGQIALEVPQAPRLGDYYTDLLYRSLTAARRARRTGVLNLNPGRNHR